jgi:hypothetical protein
LEPETALAPEKRRISVAEGRRFMLSILVVVWEKEIYDLLSEQGSEL